MRKESKLNVWSEAVALKIVLIGLKMMKSTMKKKLLCHLEPPYVTNSQLTLAFSDSDIKYIMAALKKYWEVACMLAIE